MFLLHHLCRCFGLGLGPRACRRLLQGVAKLSGGTTEFLDDEERLQPKVSSTAALPPPGETMTRRTVLNERYSVNVKLIAVKAVKIQR